MYHQEVTKLSLLQISIFTAKKDTDTKPIAKPDTTPKDTQQKVLMLELDKKLYYIHRW